MFISSHFRRGIQCDLPDLCENNITLFERRKGFPDFHSFLFTSQWCSFPPANTPSKFRLIFWFRCTASFELKWNWTSVFAVNSIRSEIIRRTTRNLYSLLPSHSSSKPFWKPLSWLFVQTRPHRRRLLWDVHGYCIFWHNLIKSSGCDFLVLIENFKEK